MESVIVIIVLFLCVEIFEVLVLKKLKKEISIAKDDLTKHSNLLKQKWESVLEKEKQLQVQEFELIKYKKEIDDVIIINSKKIKNHLVYIINSHVEILDSIDIMIDLCDEEIDFATVQVLNTLRKQTYNKYHDFESYYLHLYGVYHTLHNEMKRVKGSN